MCKLHYMALVFHFQASPLMCAELMYNGEYCKPFEGEELHYPKRNGDEILNVLVTSVGHCIHRIEEIIAAGKLRPSTNWTLSAVLSSTDSETNDAEARAKASIAELFANSKTADIERKVSKNWERFTLNFFKSTGIGSVAGPTIFFFFSRDPKPDP